MKGDRFIAWLITNGYGKITQPSDKLAVIDSELETYAPAETDTGCLRFQEETQKKKEKEKSILKESYVSGLQLSEWGLGRAPAYNTIYSRIRTLLL